MHIALPQCNIVHVIIFHLNTDLETSIQNISLYLPYVHIFFEFEKIDIFKKMAHRNDAKQYVIMCFKNKIYFRYMYLFWHANPYIFCFNTNRFFYPPYHQRREGFYNPLCIKRKNDNFCIYTFNPVINNNLSSTPTLLQ